MFESVLRSERIASGGVKTGALIATVVHAGVIAGAVFLSGRAMVGTRPPEVIPSVILWKNPGGSGAAGQAQSRTSKAASPQPERERRASRAAQAGPVIAKRATPVEPREEIRRSITDTALDQSTGDASTTRTRDGRGGQPDNCQGDDCGGGPSAHAPGPPGGPGIRVMGPGMGPPRLIDPGEPIQYTRQASEARVKGVMRVQCILTTEGRATDCTAIAPVPFMEDAVLKSLMSRRYTPVLFEGRPVPVRYNFAITLSPAE